MEFSKNSQLESYLLTSRHGHRCHITITDVAPQSPLFRRYHYSLLIIKSSNFVLKLDILRGEYSDAHGNRAKTSAALDSENIIDGPHLMSGQGYSAQGWC